LVFLQDQTYFDFLRLILEILRDHSSLSLKYCQDDALFSSATSPSIDMDPAAGNPLISSQKSSELQVVLHPLVLLTISDYITRHTLRDLGGPVIGAVLGQHNGREITMEHAFECQTLASPFAEGGYSLHEENFTTRLDQSLQCLLFVSSRIVLTSPSENSPQRPRPRLGGLVYVTS